jgi:hypothetical protein
MWLLWECAPIMLTECVCMAAAAAAALVYLCLQHAEGGGHGQRGCTPPQAG